MFLPPLFTKSLNVPSPPPAQFPPANSHSSHASAPPGLLRYVDWLDDNCYYFLVYNMVSYFVLDSLLRVDESSYYLGLIAPLSWIIIVTERPLILHNWFPKKEVQGM